MRETWALHSYPSLHISIHPFTNQKAPFSKTKTKTKTKQKDKDLLEKNQHCIHIIGSPVLPAYLPVCLPAKQTRPNQRMNPHPAKASSTSISTQTERKRPNEPCHTKNLLLPRPPSSLLIPTNPSKPSPKPPQPSPQQPHKRPPSSQQLPQQHQTSDTAPHTSPHPRHSRSTSRCRRYSYRHATCPMENAKENADNKQQWQQKVEKSEASIWVSRPLMQPVPDRWDRRPCSQEHQEVWGQR